MKSPRKVSDVDILVKCPRVSRRIPPQRRRFDQRCGGQKRGPGGWRPGEENANLPAREGEMLLGAKNTDSICAAIERHCRVLDENCELFCGQGAETQPRGKQRLVAQLLRCHA